MKEIVGKIARFDFSCNRGIITVTYSYIFLKSMKNKWVAILLCFFFGWLGFHKFYLNEKGGIIYLLLFWTGIPLILSLFDFLGLIFTSDDGFDKKFNKS